MITPKSAHEILGFIYLASTLYAINRQDDRQFKIYVAFSSVFGILSYAVIHDFVAASMLGVVGVRYWLATISRSLWLVGLFVSASLGLGLFFLKTPLEFLPLAATVFGTWIVFRMTGISMRLAFIATTSLWIIYTISIQSISQTLFQIIGLSLHAKVAYQLRMQKKIAAERGRA